MTDIKKRFKVTVLDLKKKKKIVMLKIGNIGHLGPKVNNFKLYFKAFHCVFLGL